MTEDDPDRKILIGQVLELMRFQCATNARRSAELMSIATIAIALIGLIASHIIARNAPGLACAIAASGIVGGGQIAIIQFPKVQPVVFGCAAFLIAGSLVLLFR